MKKGELNGLCNRTACQKPGASWYNSSTRAYYCGDCAEKINHYSKNDHGVILCRKVDPHMGEYTHMSRAVERGRKQILEDLAAKTFDVSIKTFSDLHDYVDANRYGIVDGTENDWDFDLGVPMYANETMSDEFQDRANDLQSALSEWIEAGGLLLYGTISRDPMPLRVGSRVKLKVDHQKWKAGELGTVTKWDERGIFAYMDDRRDKHHLAVWLKMDYGVENNVWNTFTDSVEVLA
jgi:hypothetical protein